MSHVSIRELQKGDFEAVVAVDEAITSRARRPFFAKRFEAIFEAPESAVGVVAESKGQVTGFMLGDVLDGEFGGDAPVGVLGALGVRPGAQRHGAGRRMLGALAELLGARGARHLRTEVEWSDAAVTRFFAAERFTLAPRFVLQRELGEGALLSEEGEGDARPIAVVRSMNEGDLPAIVRVDAKIVGRDRSAYYRRKSLEVLKRSGVRVSLVAEVDSALAGFVMARVDLGDYGRTEPTAVLDTIGVNPVFAREHIGHALVEQLLLNLRSLRVERAVTQVAWGQFDVIEFLGSMGFAPSQRLALER